MLAIEKNVKEQEAISAAAGTYLIGPGAQVDFTSNNIGRQFIIQTNSRLKVSINIKRMDGKTLTDTVALRFMMATGKVAAEIGVTADGKSKLYDLSYMPGGGCNIYYYGQKDVRYMVVISVYTY